MSLEKQNIPSNIKENIQEELKASLWKLWNEIYNEWNINLLPWIEQIRLSQLIENNDNNKLIVEKLSKILSIKSLV